MDRTPTRATSSPAVITTWPRRVLLHNPLLRLLSATILFALGPTLLKVLSTRGDELGLAAGGISFCNVLFVGNFCAGVTVAVLTGTRRIANELRTLSRSTLGWLLLAALVSAIYPALVFTALERTSVTNVVLLSRFNGIIYVVLAWLVFREKVRRPQAIGYALIAAGIAILILHNRSVTALRSGDALVLLATLFFALTEIISRKSLPHVSVTTYVFFRNCVSAIVFFVSAVVLFGPHHFMDAFMGDLWILMLIYAAIAIVAAQTLWLGAIKTIPAKTVADVSLVNPVFSIAFAFVLLGEIPDSMQWLVISMIAAGVLLPRLWPDGQSGDRRSPLGILTGLVGK